MIEMAEKHLFYVKNGYNGSNMEISSKKKNCDNFLSHVTLSNTFLSQEAI